MGEYIFVPYGQMVMVEGNVQHTMRVMWGERGQNKSACLHFVPEKEDVKLLYNQKEERCPTEQIPTDQASFDSSVYDMRLLRRLHRNLLFSNF